MGKIPREPEGRERDIASYIPHRKHGDRENSQALMESNWHPTQRKGKLFAASEDNSSCSRATESFILVGQNFDRLGDTK